MPSFMVLATCFPLCGLPIFIWELPGGVFAGLTGDAAVGAGNFFSGDAGADQCASREVYTSQTTWPRLNVDSRNFDAHSLRSSTCRALSHWRRWDIGSAMVLRFALKYSTCR